MSSKLVRKNDQPISPSLAEFVIDYESDVPNLPTSTKEGAEGEATCYIGSVAYLRDLSKVWILGPDDLWHLAE